MAGLVDIVKKGSTDRSVTIRIIDSTDGTPETGVVWNTAGIDLWYRREGEAVTSITEATLASLTTAHTDGGFLHVSNGEYRLDIPDAAFATAANYVDIGGTVTGMVVIGGRVRLVDYDLEDSVRLGLTALPSAAAGAAGGLPTDSTGKTSFNDIAATDVVSGGAINTTTGAVDSVTTVTTTTTNTDMRGTDSAATAAALATVDANVDAILIDTADMQPRVAAIETDTGTTLETHLTDIKGATFSGATDSLEAIRDRGDAAWTTGAGGADKLVLQDTTIATIATQTSFTLTAGSADNDAYNNCTIVIEDATTATQKAVGMVLSYTGATRTVTLKEALAFTIAATDKVYILAENSLKSTISNRQLDVTATGAAGIDWSNIENPATVVDLSGTDIQLADTCTTNTDMRGTDSAATAAALATVDANVGAILSDTADMQPKLGTPAGTDISADIAAVKAETASIQTDTNAIEVDTQDIQTQIGTAGAGLTDLGGMSIGMKAEAQQEATDALNAYDPPTNAEMEARTPTAAQLAYIVSNAADGLPVTFTGGTTTTAILGTVDGSAASSTNDVYNDRILIFNSGTLNQQATDITAYDGATKTATITAVTTAVTSSHTANMK